MHPKKKNDLTFGDERTCFFFIRYIPDFPTSALSGRLLFFFLSRVNTRLNEAYLHFVALELDGRPTLPLNVHSTQYERTSSAFMQLARHAKIFLSIVLCYTYSSALGTFIRVSFQYFFEDFSKTEIRRFSSFATYRFDLSGFIVVWFDCLE